MENGWVWVSERDGKGDFGFVKPFEKNYRVESDYVEVNSKEKIQKMNSIIFSYTYVFCNYIL